MSFFAACSALCAVSLNGYIYVAGGYDGVSALNSVECYDPLSNSWRIVAPMQRARSAAAAISLNDRIYVIGGHDGSQIESSVYINIICLFIIHHWFEYLLIILILLH